MLTQTITAPAVPAAKVFPAPRAQTAPAIDQFSVIASLRRRDRHRVFLPEGRGNLRRRRAFRIRLSGGPRRGSHLQASQRRTAPDRRVPSARRRVRPRCRLDPSPDRRSDRRHHRPPGEAPQPRSRRGSNVQVAHNLWTMTAGELRHAEDHMLLLGRKTAMEKVATFPAGNGPSARQGRHDGAADVPPRHRRLSRPDAGNRFARRFRSSATRAFWYFRVPVKSCCAIASGWPTWTPESKLDDKNTGRTGGQDEQLSRLLLQGSLQFRRPQLQVPAAPDRRPIGSAHPRRWCWRNGWSTTSV